MLPVREVEGRLEVFLVHPGGPFYVRKDEGIWSLPKGLLAEGEDPLAAAKRELSEETGFGARRPALTSSSGRSNRRAARSSTPGPSSPTSIPRPSRADTFELEWPPRSGKMERFPEVDGAGWFDLSAAAQKILPAQQPLLERVAALRDQILG